MITTRTILAPAAYASYFINGDASGLTLPEIVEADAWFAANVDSANGESIVDCSEESFFSSDRNAWAFTPYKAGDVAEYTILSHNA